MPRHLSTLLRDERRYEDLAQWLSKSRDVLYLGRGAETARALIGATEGAPVLTVGDRDAGTPGGVIDFVLKSEKVRFAANVKRAKARRLDLSAKLLDVAAEVTR